MISERTKDYLNTILETANGNEELSTAIVRLLSVHICAVYAQRLFVRISTNTTA